MAINRTGLYVRRSAGGLFAVEDMAVSTGARFFVDSTTGADEAGNGTGPDNPVATIDYAMSLCTASKGDIVYVMPYHAENITGASGIACDVIGVQVIGLGTGNAIPKITATAAAGACTISVADVTLRNLRFIANFETGVTQTIAIAAGGDGTTLDGVQIRDTSATFEYLSHINVATTVTDLTIKNCDVVSLAGSLVSSILFAGTTSDVVIEDNHFFVDSSDSVINHSTGDSTNITIRRNVIANEDTGAAGYCIELKSTGTGIVHDNYMAYNKVDAEIGTGAAAWWFQNYASNTIAQSGLLDPTTAHAIP